MKRLLVFFLTLFLLLTSGCEASQGDFASHTSSLCGNSAASAQDNSAVTSVQNNASDSSSKSEPPLPSRNETSSLPPDRTSSDENQGDETLKEIVFNNKLADNGNDPWVIFENGFYYYCYSGKGGIYVSAAKNLNEISTQNGVLVWSPDDENYNSELWAPELHFIWDKWYIYVAADNGDNYNHRMLCLEGTSCDPLDRFVTKSILRAETDRWAIDGSVMQYEDNLYFIWSGWEGFENVSQNIYIAEMENPWTVKGDRVMLSSPTYEWEKQGGIPHINEGPTILVLNGVYHLVYSASGSWCDDYCLGLLTLKGSDPMDTKAWAKSDTPVFSKTDRIFGPGHASFTVSPDGSRHYIAYHANEESGTGWNGRRLWVQEFFVDENNYPVFNSPMPAGTMQSVSQNR